MLVLSIGDCLSVSGLHCTSDFFLFNLFLLLVELYERRDMHALQLLRSIVATIMWRHRKPHVEHEIKLPPCSVQDVVLPLSPLERSYYDRRHEEMVRSLKSANTWTMTPDLLAKLTTLRQVMRTVPAHLTP